MPTPRSYARISKRVYQYPNASSWLFAAFLAPLTALLVHDTVEAEWLAEAARGFLAFVTMVAAGLLGLRGFGEAQRPLLGRGQTTSWKWQVALMLDFWFFLTLVVLAAAIASI